MVLFISPPFGSYINLPQTVSIKGSCDSVVVRPVCSRDVMTAKFAKIDWPIVDEIATELYKITEIDSVFYDITHKPPGTFGWE